MRIATITNWAYGATVCLTIASGIIMLMASSADTLERQAVEQRQKFDQLTEDIETDIWAQSDLARLYAIKKDPQVLKEYNQAENSLKRIELRLEKLQDNGASDEELALLHEGIKIVDELQDEQQTALESLERGEYAQAVALLYGQPYEQELERAQNQLYHFRQILDKRVIAAVQEATKKSKALRTASELTVGLTALLFLFVLGFILKRRVLRPVVRLSDVVHRLASQDYAVETPNFNQIDEIGDMAQAISIFRENGLARQRLEKERDADWAIRELLARMTQRLQGCENFNDVINVAELFAPNIAPGIAGRLYVLDREPWQMRCVAQWLSPVGEETTFHPDECWAVRRGQSHPPVNGEPDIACYHLPASQAESALCVPLIAQGEAIGLLSFQNITADNAPSRAYLELMAEALGLALANQPLSEVLDENIGRTWRTDLSQLSELEQHIDFPTVNKAVREAKLLNKKRLAVWLAMHLNVVANPKALFDVQIKRIHEYKRQLMNVLHVITHYNRIKADPTAEWVPRVKIFAGKAASAYYMAKHIIHLINDVAKVVNQDPDIGDKLKVVFIPNYSVSLAQLIIPAADLSEQISTAGTEASGTSNMKFALNGALTIGTLDGANVEMLEHVGEENIFIFGNTTEEVEALRRKGYSPRQYYEEDEELRQVLTQIATGVFSPDEPSRYRDLVDSLINFGDHYQVLADYRSYVDCQDKVDELYRQPEKWTSAAMYNIANMGYFSSDRTIKEYAETIWHIDPVRL